MDFQERMDLLMKRAEEEYGKLLKDADFSDENMLKEAGRIASIDMIYRNLEGLLAGSPTDVEAMLFYDRPLEAFYNSLREQDQMLLNGMVEALNGFLTDTRKHIYEVWVQGEPALAEEMRKAQEFFAMEQEIERQAEKEEREMAAGTYQGTAGDGDGKEEDGLER